MSTKRRASLNNPGPHCRLGVLLVEQAFSMVVVMQFGALPVSFSNERADSPLVFCRMSEPGAMAGMARRVYYRLEKGPATYKYHKNDLSHGVGPHISFPPCRRPPTMRHASTSLPSFHRAAGGRKILPNICAWDSEREEAKSGTMEAAEGSGNQHAVGRVIANGPCMRPSRTTRRILCKN